MGLTKRQENEIFLFVLAVSAGALFALVGLAAAVGGALAVGLAYLLADVIP